MGAKQHGMPGEWAKVKGTVLSLWPLFLCFTALGAFGAALLLGRHTVLFAALFVASLAAAAAFWRNGLRRVESFFKGARGEERAAGVLGALPDAWHVFHDFAAGGHHVDHVVVGPGGVFSVETKSWSAPVTEEDGELLVGGRLPDRPPLVQAKREAAAVKEALARAGWEGDVTPVVCFASDTFSGGLREFGPVTVANSDAVLAWLRARPSVMDAAAVARLAQLMETCV